MRGVAMSSNKHFQAVMDPGEKYYLFSQSALDDLIENHVKAEREACAQVCENAPEPDGYDLAERIRARGNVTSAE